MGEIKEVHGIPQFNGQGFDDWQFRVKIHLDSLDLLEVLTGDPPDDATKKVEFKKKDKKAMDRIVSFLHADCISFVRDKETAKAMWQSLQSVFAKKSVTNQVLIRKQLAKMKMNDGDSIVSHVMAFENLIRKLKLSGACVEESDVLAQLFLTLPDKYDPLVTAMQNMENGQLTFNIVKERLISEEAKFLDRDQANVEEKAAFSSKKNAFRKAKPRFNGKCFKCDKFGHKSKDCWQREARSAKTNTKAVAFMAYRNRTRAEKAEIVFKLDSGASDHLAKDKDIFSTMSSLDNPVEINVAKDNESIVAKNVGVVQGVSNKGIDITMKDVLYAPTLRDNLLSVRKLTKAGLKVNFVKNKAMILKDGEEIASAYLRGNLYELTLTHKENGAFICHQNNFEIWHKRLGHIGTSGMKNVLQQNLIKENIKPNVLGFCDICTEAKQCREPFDGTRSRSTRLLERIHSDVCGPITPVAWDGSKYFVSFIDDYSHFAMIFCIKKKSEVFQKFKEYEAMVTTMFPNVKISNLTIDQGTEYLSKAQLEWYKSKGIQVEPTIAYTPQQNGVSERFNRTVTEKIRAMILDSGVPKFLWNEAALAAVYVINRIPTRALNEMVTPAEKWFGNKPNYDKLRIFGTKAYAWIPDKCRKKLDSKSKKTIFIGYAPNGYRLWDMQARKVILARDVKFDENCFPYKGLVNESSEPKIIWSIHEQEGEDGNDAVSAEENSANNKAESEEPIAQMNEQNEVTSDEDDSQNSAEENDPDIGKRRSLRIKQFPMKFMDYITGHEANVVQNNIPESFNEIFNRDDTDSWMQAVNDELNSMKKNHVWDLVKPPVGAKILKTKWVFKLKEDCNGNLTKYKARLVAKGFLQKHGIDYWETYAPVAKLTTVRIALAIGVRHGYHFHQLDVKTAFLHGDLKEDIYIEIPHGVKADPGLVCKLEKSLYGLKQAPKCWNEKFNVFLQSLGFSRSRHDYCLYFKMDTDKASVLILILYVDDVLVVGNNINRIMDLKTQLSKHFEMSDCGPLKHFLGMNMDLCNGELSISQEASISKILNKFGMTECNPVKSPMEKGLQLQKGESPTNPNLPYRQLLGSLMYIMVCSRPDICYHVGYLGRFQENPNEIHWQHLKRVLRYLKGTMKMKLNFRNYSDEPVIGYADADWATDLSDRKSVSGYMFKVYGCTVSWCSKKQQTVATSSSEAEYIALSMASTEALWIRGVLEDLREISGYAVKIFEDNKGCIGMSNNLESKRAKHIDIKHHFVRDNIMNGNIVVEHIRSEKQLADLFTKSLDTNKFQKLRVEAGIID